MKFEKIASRYAIKAKELSEYLGVSKATIYNYRDKEISQLPPDKKIQILHLFEKEKVEDLEEMYKSCKNADSAKISDRIRQLIKEQGAVNLGGEEQVKKLEEEILNQREANLKYKSQIAVLGKFEGIDDFTKTVWIEKVAAIVNGTSSAEIRQFIEYLEIFEAYRKSKRNR